METLLRLVLVLGAGIIALIGALFVLALVNPVQHERNVAQFDPKHRQFRDDPVLGHTILERAHGFSLSNGRPFSYHYGELGERISRPTESKSDTAPDVVIIGGSIPWGQGVTNSDTLASVLQRDTGLRTMNLSVPGASTLYSALRLEQLAQLKPSVIVYVFYHDHLYRNIRKCFPADAPLCVRLPIVEKDGQKYRIKKPAYLVENLFGGITQLLSDWYVGQNVKSKPSILDKMFWSAAKLYKDAYSSFFEPKSYNDESLRPYVLAALDVSLKMMKGWADERKAKLVVLYYPMTQFPKAVDPMDNDVKEVVEQYSIPIIDMAPIFNKVPSVDGRTDYPWSLENDGHPNALGHRLMADAIKQLLKRDNASATIRH